jgi:hypothetical protein
VRRGARSFVFALVLVLLGAGTAAAAASPGELNGGRSGAGTAPAAATPQDGSDTDAAVIAGSSRRWQATAGESRRSPLLEVVALLAAVLLAAPARRRERSPVGTSPLSSRWAGVAGPCRAPPQAAAAT